MTVSGVPVLFLVLFAVGVGSVLGCMALCYLLSRRLSLTWIRQGPKKSLIPELFSEREWTLSKDQEATLRKALWGGNAHIRAVGVFHTVWGIRLLFAMGAASILGGALTLTGAAE